MVISPYEQLQVVEREREIMILKLSHNKREELFNFSMMAFFITAALALSTYLLNGLASGFSKLFVNLSFVAIGVFLVGALILFRKKIGYLRYLLKKLRDEIEELESIFQSMIRLLSVNQEKPTEFKKEWDRYLSLVDKKQE